MSYWLTDPQLFLYAKGTGPDDVHLWRCKKPASSSSSSSSSSLVVPMKPDDFEYVETVTDYMELLANTIDWDETDYKTLVNYIFERRLLVNNQGFVIVEVHKADKDGNKMVDDANEENLGYVVPAAIYIRSLDVLALKPYIPKLRERPIPLRTVQVLEDLNGKAAVMNIKEYSDDVITKLTARVADLESENKTLEGKVTKLTADLVTQMNAFTALQQEDKNNTTEVWMNDIITGSGWVGVEGLRHYDPFDDLIIVCRLDTFTVDDISSTNVRARYWYKIKPYARGYDLKAVCLEDLTPNKERARFSYENWYSFESKGKPYVFRN